MPLSDHEQRMLRQIERQLQHERGLARILRMPADSREAARNARRASVAFVAGLLLLSIVFSSYWFIGLVGFILLRLDFHPAPILLGFVLGPRFEENFRRSLLISRGDLMTFLERPISAFFLTICVVLIVAQIYVWLRKPKIIAEEKAIEAQVPRTSYSELAG